MSWRRPTLTALSLVLLSTLSLGSASAAGLSPAQTSADSQRVDSAEFPQGADTVWTPNVPATQLGGVHYIEASTEAEALKKLDALEALRTGKTASIQARAVAAGVTYGPCTLAPENIHLRQSSNYSKIGYKTKTSCDAPVSSIKHETDLRYKWVLWWRKAGGTTTSKNAGVKSLYQKTAEYTCKGAKSTAWSGTTLGTIVYKGKTFYARVYAAQVDRNCKA